MKKMRKGGKKRKEADFIDKKLILDMLKDTRKILNNFDTHPQRLRRLSRESILVKRDNQLMIIPKASKKNVLFI